MGGEVVREAAKACVDAYRVGRHVSLEKPLESLRLGVDAAVMSGVVYCDISQFFDLLWVRPPDTAMSRTALRIWSFAGIALAYAVFVHVSYSYALANHMLPYTLWPRWPALEVLALLVMTGVFGVVVARPRALVKRPWLTGLAAALYAAIAVGVLALIQGVIAFVNGDGV